MSALDSNPASQDGLLPNRYRFQLKRAPNVNFWAHRVVIPGFSSQPAPNQNNPFNRIPVPGDHLDWDPLILEFQVDNSMANYLELSTWMRELYFPKSFSQYKTLTDGKDFLGTGVKSEIVVTLQNGQMVPKFEVVFHDAFPTSLGSFELTSMKQEVPRVLCQASFAYESFDVLPLNPN